MVTQQDFVQRLHSFKQPLDTSHGLTSLFAGWHWLLRVFQEWLCFTSLLATYLSQGPSILSWKIEGGPLLPGYALQGLVQTPYFSYVEPNWIPVSLTLEQHWGDIRFRLCVEAKLSSTNVAQTLSKLTLLPHQAKTAVPNWFRCRSFAVLNLSVRFGTWVEQKPVPDSEIAGPAELREREDKSKTGGNWGENGQQSQ